MYNSPFVSLPSIVKGISTNSSVLGSVLSVMVPVKIQEFSFQNFYIVFILT